MRSVSRFFGLCIGFWWVVEGVHEEMAILGKVGPQARGPRGKSETGIKGIAITISKTLTRYAQ